MILRAVIVVAMLVSALFAPASMASAAAEPAEMHQASTQGDGMDDCHSPNKAPACRLDCALCHALAPSTGSVLVALVTFVPFDIETPRIWDTGFVEVEPPIPRASGQPLEFHVNHSALTGHGA